ncbi:MAG: SsrA-binding protein SmpB [Bacteroidetes bacterium]|nr:MAG: SsrA-binding protein SmpB [Bacteroidota bacterium]REJ99807.1 MAG: SsrA-binding protein SmpB [Bacteroidota bacterium]REK34180.1 MAG: SsrA-binding protein SmpB [Bacteroidota bacterium]REK50510.1 MAG: SsrA-binding protein SmpB [Bacteroidota bacterium]
MSKQATVIKNRKASYEYALMQSFTAGIVLTGTEVKSIREGKANINDAYCILENGELWIKEMHISEFKQGSYNNHEPKRLRKLLLKKTELAKIKSKLKEKGITIIPVQLYFNERGFAKLDISLAKGKKMHDKREDIKKKDQEREISRVVR